MARLTRDLGGQTALARRRTGDARLAQRVGEALAARGKAPVEACREFGWSGRINSPYAGTIVSRSFYRQEPRVHSVLIEVNRRLYLAAGIDAVRRSAGFAAVQRGVEPLVRMAPGRSAFGVHGRLRLNRSRHSGVWPELARFCRAVG